MPDNSSLPKPNIPNPLKSSISKSGSGVASTGNNNSTTGVSSQKTQSQVKSIPQAPSSAQVAAKQTADSSPKTNNTSSQVASAYKPFNSSKLAKPTVSSPAGLDPQSPGGPMPKINQQGQVLHTSTISQTPKSQDFSKQAELPVSKMQQIQQRSANLPNAQQNKTMETSAINPARQAGDKKDAVSVGSQQAIAPTPSTSSQQKQAAHVTHPSLGSSVPPIGRVKAQKKGLFGGKFNKKDDKELKQADKKITPKKKGQETKVSATQPKFATVKKPITKYVAFGLVGLLIVAGVIFGISKIVGGDKTPIADPTDNGESNQPVIEPGSRTGSGDVQSGGSGATITYWGLWEPEKVLQEVLTDFQQETGITVIYEQKSHQDYRTHLQSAIASAAGPDVFRFHASWVPMLKNELAPIPSRIMSLSEYEQTFFPVAVQQLQSKGQLVGIPLMYDGLALYYNKSILQTANEEPPETWAELRILANKLTVRSANGVERGGLAIGNVDNVEHFADIIGLLIMQNGGNPAEPLSGEVRDAIQFYASFARSTPVYSTALPSSTMAFAREEVAMMLAPSWRVHEIKQINPELDFDIAPAPKLSEDDFGWANFWAEGVNVNSNYSDEAWQLLKYLSSKEVLQKLYAEQSQIRAFGEIYPRQDMMTELYGADYVDAYIQDAPKAVSWHLCSYTHDGGINDRIIDYYKDAISVAIGGNLTEKELQTLSDGVTQTLRQYGF